jgi:hypothetical protein
MRVLLQAPQAQEGSILHESDELLGSAAEMASLCRVKRR